MRRTRIALTEASPERFSIGAAVGSACGAATADADGLPTAGAGAKIGVTDKDGGSLDGVPPGTVEANGVGTAGAVVGFCSARGLPAEDEEVARG